MLTRNVDHWNISQVDIVSSLHLTVFLRLNTIHSFRVAERDKFECNEVSTYCMTLCKHAMIKSSIAPSIAFLNTLDPFSTKVMSVH